jgi:REP element-mobilizing transposase RayT
MTQPPVTLDLARRSVVDATIREVCMHRGWTLHALNVRTTHLHVVVAADRTPERVMTDFKAYSTRRMREAAVLPANIDPWSYHGSTRYLDSSNSLARAIDYTLNDQGSSLPVMPQDEPAR